METAASVLVSYEQSEAQAAKHFKDNAEMSVAGQSTIARGVAIHLDQVWREFEGL